MYQPIGDYALIGDTHSAALISSKGSIDWLCLPYFDSPALLMLLLDDTAGGYCEIKPARLVSTKRRYLDGTNILETVFETERPPHRNGPLSSSFVHKIKGVPVLFKNSISLRLLVPRPPSVS